MAKHRPGEPKRSTRKRPKPAPEELDSGLFGTPEDRLDAIVSDLSQLGLPSDADEIMMIGIGPLESLYHGGYEDRLWPRTEALARNDARFRHALAAVWAYDSSRYDDRCRLLDELGERYGPDDPA